MAKRAFTPAQQSNELVKITSQLDALATVVRSFEVFWTEPVPEGGVPDAVGAAWNSVHDSIRALEAHRAYVELNPRVYLTGQEAELARLVSLNID